MPRPCSVCAHLERANIDRLLSRQVVNAAEVARTFGLPSKAVLTHRRQHLGGFLPSFSVDVAPDALGAHYGEMRRLYDIALDALATAEVGTIARINDDGTVERKVSNSAISRAIREARVTLTEVVRLAADGAEADQRPTGQPDGALAARITAALDRVVARGLEAGGPTRRPTLPSGVDETLDVEGEEAPEATAQGLTHRAGPQTPGGHVGDGGHSSPPQIPLDAAMAKLASLSRLPEKSRQAVEQDIVTTHIDNNRDDRVIMTVPNKRYPGSIAASSEERAQAGYPDIEVTIDDLKSNRDVVAELVAEHRQRLNERPTTA